VNLLILVVDDEPDVEVLFRQQFRHDLRAGRFTMDFAQSGDMALQRITDAESLFLRPDRGFAGARRSCQGWPLYQPCGILQRC
jgi:CheY-like chemotaxis protein